MNVVQPNALDSPIPVRIGRLTELAYNLWWTWHPEAQTLFSEVDPELWELVYHNPVKFLNEVRQASLLAASENPGYVARYDAVMSRLDEYMSSASTWFLEAHPNLQGPVAYFSFEFGLHESLPIYSGGLGVLAGDHVKGASDLGVPMVFVGYLYPQGYFRQIINQDGWQEAIY
ncbi:MAG TPA: DUF3417 domain-containing protein, partial [Chloroflexia bacterium]|nr:DUF3417 domain-containing protein [Chloroflexia bacterium]